MILDNVVYRFLVIFAAYFQNGYQVVLRLGSFSHGISLLFLWPFYCTDTVDYEKNFVYGGSANGIGKRFVHRFEDIKFLISSSCKYLQIGIILVKVALTTLGNIFSCFNAIFLVLF